MDIHGERIELNGERERFTRVARERLVALRKNLRTQICMDCTSEIDWGDLSPETQKDIDNEITEIIREVEGELSSEVSHDNLRKFLEVSHRV